MIAQITSEIIKRAQHNNSSAFTPFCLILSNTIKEKMCIKNKTCFIILYNLHLKTFFPTTNTSQHTRRNERISSSYVSTTVGGQSTDFIGTPRYSTS
jgi:hypothetical protein